MPKPRITSRQRRAVIERAKGRCEYCIGQSQFSSDSFSVEHVVPRSRGGEDKMRNLALSGQGCNSRKHTHTTALDPVSGEAVPLCHPRQHAWSNHFAWNEDLTRIIGLTPMGRATVERLQLNRDGVVNLRRVLRIAGEHPPTE